MWVWHTWWPEYSLPGLVTQKQIFSQWLLCKTTLQSERIECPEKPSIIFAQSLQSIKSAHVEPWAIGSLSAGGVCVGRGSVVCVDVVICGFDKTIGRAYAKRKAMLNLMLSQEELNITSTIVEEVQRCKDSCCVIVLITSALSWNGGLFMFFFFDRISLYPKILPMERITWFYALEGQTLRWQQCTTNKRTNGETLKAHYQ